MRNVAASDFKAHSPCDALTFLNQPKNSSAKPNWMRDDIGVAINSQAQSSSSRGVQKMNSTISSKWSNFETIMNQRMKRQRGFGYSPPLQSKI